MSSHQPRDARRRGEGLARLVAPSLAGALGCAGSIPLSHPAHPLAVGEVSAGAGVSGRFADRSTDRAIAAGREAARSGLDTAEARNRYAEGVLSEAALSPGTSPWLALRVGLPHESEAGMTYTGRSLRVDARRAFVSDEYALSVGLGGSFSRESPDSNRPGAEPRTDVELEATGLGIELPVIAGYRSQGDFVDLWAGARVGYESFSGELTVADALDVESLDATGKRLWAGALIGLAVGVPPLWFRFELDTTFHRVSGALRDANAGSGPAFARAEGSGWTLSPSAGLVGTF